MLLKKKGIKLVGFLFAGCLESDGNIANCPILKTLGYCELNSPFHSFMQYHCQITCNFCVPC